MKPTRWLIIPLFFAAWLVLTNGNTALWPLGLLASVVAGTLCALAIDTQRSGIVWLRLPVFAGFFLINSLKGGWRVALIALNPSTRLSPTLVTVPSRLKSESAQKLTLSLMTLMPGTIGVSTDGKNLLIHLLMPSDDIADEVAQLERQIAALLIASEGGAS